jgi:hypothetical protein
MSKRFILRFRGKGNIAADDIARVAGLHGVEIAEETTRMLLVDGEESVLKAFTDASEDWLLFPEQRVYGVPDPRHKVRGIG